MIDIQLLRNMIDYLERTTWQRTLVSAGVYQLTSPRTEAASPPSSELNSLIVGFDKTAVNPIQSQVKGITTNGVIQYAGQNGAGVYATDPTKAKFSPRVTSPLKLLRDEVEAHVSHPTPLRLPSK